MSETTMKVLELIITALMIIITRWVVPYLKGKINEMTENTTSKAIKDAVEAMELMFPEIGTGVVKKHEAVKFLSGYLHKKGVKITEDELNILVEAAVSAMKKGN